MDHCINSAKSFEQRGTVADIGDDERNSPGKFAAADREIVIDDHLMARRQELSYSVRANISGASGHQYFHAPPDTYAALPLWPTTISELPKGIGNVLRVFCSMREIWNRRLFIHSGGTLGASG